jgi:hypothetical protein
LVGVVNESFVRRFLPGRSALGALVYPVRPLGSDDQPTPITIIGIVNDAIYRTVREEPEPTLYQPLSQRTSRIPPAEIALSIRVSRDSPMRLAHSVAAALAALDRDLAYTFRPFGDQVKASLVQERVVAWVS